GGADGAARRGQRSRPVRGGREDRLRVRRPLPVRGRPMPPGGAATVPDRPPPGGRVLPAPELPRASAGGDDEGPRGVIADVRLLRPWRVLELDEEALAAWRDRKSTRLNSRH